MVLLGESPLGFRFVAICCYLLAFGLFFKSFEKLTKRILLSWISCVFIFTLPLIEVCGISLFCEPYLLFCLGLVFFGITHVRSQRFIFFVFTAGLMTKYSFLLWSPLLLADAMINRGLIFNVKNIAILLKNYFVQTRWIYFVWFIFSAANAVKFGSLTWFAGIQEAEKSDWIGLRFWHWIQMISESAPPFISLLVFALMLVAALLGMREWRKNQRITAILLLPVFIHFIAFGLSGAPRFSRYLVQFLPLYYLAGFAGIYYLVRNIRWLYFVTCIGLFILIWPSILSPKSAIGGSPLLGRQVYTLRHELNRPGAVMHDQYLWVTSGFRDRLKNIPCVTDECFEAERVGYETLPFEYALKDKLLWKISPFGIHPSEKLTSSTVSIPLSKEMIADFILKKLKLGKAFRVDQILETKAFPAANPAVRPLFDGSEITIIAHSLRTIFGVMEIGDELIVKATLGIHDLHENLEPLHSPRYWLLARVDQTSLRGEDLTDLVMAHFFEGYVLPVQVLPIHWSHQSWIFNPEIGKTGIVAQKISLSRGTL
jgi:hypothetical protein